MVAKYDIKDSETKHMDGHWLSDVYTLQRMLQYIFALGNYFVSYL